MRKAQLFIIPLFIPNFLHVQRRMLYASSHVRNDTCFSHLTIDYVDSVDLDMKEERITPLCNLPSNK